MRGELENGDPPFSAALYWFPMDSPENSIVRHIGHPKLAIAECEMQFPRCLIRLAIWNKYGRMLKMNFYPTCDYLI